MELDEINQTLNAIQEKLPNDGRLLVTVPNGYGWFELENFFWNKLRAGQFLEWVGFVELVYQIKKIFLAKKIDHPPHPSTLSESPHIQHFTASTIQKILKALKPYELKKIIVGYPIHMNGKVGFLADEVKHFVALLEQETSCSVILWDERLTSVQAQRALMEGGMSRKKRSQLVDSVSAIILLQSYLGY